MSLKKAFLALAFLPLISLPSQASFGKDLEGSFLGVSKYKMGRKGPNLAATRIYLDEVQGERGSYHAVLLEYVNIMKMFPQYAATNAVPKLNELIGHLKYITKKVQALKIVPTNIEGKMNIYPLIVEGDKIVADKANPVGVLTVQKSSHPSYALGGAEIRFTAGQKGAPQEIFFPYKGDGKISGLQYHKAKIIYETIGLDSTWRKNFLTGPYLSAYGRTNDEVLSLSTDRGQEIMDFKISSTASGMKKSEREEMFTNKKSAFLEGTFESLEPVDGMFIVKPINAQTQTNKEMSKRIGLFIDIFDATKKLNQDVVELVFVNPENPEDFLMYYEHPENGEGN